MTAAAVRRCLSCRAAGIERWLVLALALLATPPALAAPPGEGPARYRFHDRVDGVGCGYFDTGLRWPWATSRAVGGSSGVSARASFGTRVARIDVTALVTAWLDASTPNDGLLVSLVDGPLLTLQSRESADPALRPQLLLKWQDGRTQFVEAAADAALDCTTYRGVGTRQVLELRARSPLVMRFDLDHLADRGARAPDKNALASAHLVLVRAQAVGKSAPTQMLVQPLAPPLQDAGAHPAGLASSHPLDGGLASADDVLFADGFDEGELADGWAARWSGTAEVVDRVPAAAGGALSGPALKVTIPKGQQLGLDLRLPLAPLAGGTEPEEAYFRYHLLLGEGWLPAADGGKLPGFASTYGVAAWGGRAWDGRKGWSLRGAFNTPLPREHPAAGYVVLGNYAYHSKSQKYGDWLGWPMAGAGSLLRPGRWTAIEQHVRLNTPGQSDGWLRVWVDGQLALDRRDLRLRDLPGIRIQEVWMNFFLGGTQRAAADMHAYVDQVVVARQYIGPMAGR